MSLILAHRVLHTEPKRKITHEAYFYHKQNIKQKMSHLYCIFFFRYLATGDALNTISFSYRLGHSTVHKIVRDTCQVITTHLMKEMMPTPTEEMWMKIATDFYKMWNFPNCIGAIDGKHIVIQAPPNSGSMFFNYKKTFSIILLALVDAHCNFIAVDVGAYGKDSDGGVFAKSQLGKALQQENLNIPARSTIPNTDIPVPYVIVGDEAFPLKTYLMRPYPGDNLNDRKRNFNYRLCRARRTSENTFGILVQKFRVYNRRIQAFPKYVDNIILSTCLLHNFIKKYDRHTYNYVTSQVDLRGENRPIQNLQLQGGNATTAAFDVRETFTDFFNSDAGSLPW